MDELKSYRRVFTLVELLIVIAIFSVLTALLIPQLQKTLNHGAKVQCLNHIRLIATGCLIYGEDHDDFFPFINEGDISWDDRASVYLGGRDLTLADQQRMWWKTEWILDTLICPNDSRQENQDNIKTYTIMLNPGYMTTPEGYSVKGRPNVATVLSGPYPGGPLPREYKSVQQFSDIQSPSTTAVISEYDQWLNLQGRGMHDHNYIRLDRQSSTNGNWGKTYLLHDFNANYLFMDGHVENLLMLDEKALGTTTRLDASKGIWTTDPND